MSPEQRAIADIAQYIRLTRVARENVALGLTTGVDLPDAGEVLDVVADLIGHHLDVAL